MFENIKQAMEKSVERAQIFNAVHNRGLDIINVSNSLKHQCAFRIFLQKLPSTLTVLLFWFIPVIAFAESKILVLIISLCAFAFIAFIQRDIVKLLNCDFSVYGAMCMGREENNSSDSSDSLLFPKSKEARQREQDSSGFFIFANTLKLKCNWASYKHTERSRYMYVIEINGKQNQEYYFVNAPNHIEETRHGEYFPK